MAGKIVRCATQLPSAILKIFCYLLGFVIFVTLCVLFLPFYILYLVYRYGLLLIVYCSHPEATSLSSADAMWLIYAEPEEGVINALLIFDGEMDLEKFQNAFDKRCVRHREHGRLVFPKLSHYMTQILRQWIWIPEPDYSIEKHIFAYDKVANTQEELHSYISSLCNEYFPPRQSPWQWILMPMAGELSGKFAALFRFHHSVGDGISLIRLLYQNLADEKVEVQVPTKQEGRRFVIFVLGVQLIRKLWIMLYGPPLYVKDQMKKAEPYHLMEKNSLTSTMKMAVSESIDLGRMKAIKTKTNSTITSLFASSITGALREMVQQKNSNIPRSVIVTSTVFLRPPVGGTKLTNDVGAIFVSLPFSTEDDKVRLAETTTRFKEINAGPAAGFYRFLMRYFAYSLPRSMIKHSSDEMSKKISFSISNIPGPKVPMTIHGCPMTSVTFWPLVAKMGCAFSLMSYRDSLRIGVVTDPGLLDNPYEIAQRIREKIYGLADEESRETDVVVEIPDEEINDVSRPILEESQS